MFDHTLIEKHPFENVPLNRDIYLMDEQWMQAYERVLLNQFNSADYKPVGYISYAAARSISDDVIELSWYPNIHTRFHEVRVLLPRSQFVICTECWQYDEKPRIFVKGAWLNNIYLRSYSVFALIDADGVKDALTRGEIARQNLVELRKRIDDIAAKYPTFSFISFADSLLIKSNWFVGQFDSDIRYTYEPESLIRILPEINSAYLDTIRLTVYAVIAQGSNEYYNDSLLHISRSGNHVSLNSLGLPFAQLQAIESAARKAVRNRAHPKSQLYMDGDFVMSINFDRHSDDSGNLAFDKNNYSRFEYKSPMSSGNNYYVCDSFQSILDNIK